MTFPAKSNKKSGHPRKLGLFQEPSSWVGPSSTSHWLRATTPWGFPSVEKRLRHGQRTANCLWDAHIIFRMVINKATGAHSYIYIYDIISYHILYYIILYYYYIILYYILLYYILFYFLYYIILYYNILFFIILYNIILYYITVYYIILYIQYVWIPMARDGYPVHAPYNHSMS
jgi:hypothetical protein